MKNLSSWIAYQFIRLCAIFLDLGQGLYLTHQVQDKDSRHIYTDESQREVIFNIRTAASAASNHWVVALRWKRYRTIEIVRKINQ